MQCFRTFSRVIAPTAFSQIQKPPQASFYTACVQVNRPKIALPLVPLQRYASSMASSTGNQPTPREVSQLILSGDITRLIDILKKHPRLLNQPNQFSLPPLYQAIAANNLDMISALLDAGANPNQPTRFGEYPIHLASKSCNVAIVTLLLSRGADACAQDAYGNTSLHVVARRNHLELYLLLTNAGANVATANERRELPLDCFQQKSTRTHTLSPAAQQTHKQAVVRMLEANQLQELEHWLKSNKTSNMLHLAIESKCSREALQLIFKHTSDIDAPDHQGNTALHLAITHQRADLVDDLLQQGASLHVLNAAKYTPRTWADKLNHADVSRVIQEHLTLEKLKEAISNQNLLHVQQLWKLYDFTSVKDKGGNTLLHLAVLDSSIEIVEFLIKQGVSLNARANKGYSALHLAQARQHKTMIELLKKYGATL